MPETSEPKPSPTPNEPDMTYPRWQEKWGAAGRPLTPAECARLAERFPGLMRLLNSAPAAE
jgi:hypothetical protein